jgi:hypothetical protein
MSPGVGRRKPFQRENKPPLPNEGEKKPRIADLRAAREAGKRAQAEKSMAEQWEPFDAGDASKIVEMPENQEQGEAGVEKGKDMRRIAAALEVLKIDLPEGASAEDSDLEKVASRLLESRLEHLMDLEDLIGVPAESASEKKRKKIKELEDMGDKLSEEGIKLDKQKLQEMAIAEARKDIKDTVDSLNDSDYTITAESEWYTEDQDILDRLNRKREEKQSRLAA